MKQFLYPALLAIYLTTASFSAWTQQFQTSVPMKDKGAETYYVAGEISGFGEVEFMVDTGSGYMTINEQTLYELIDRGEARYVKSLTAMLANGETTVVPVYLLTAVNIGGQCWVNNVEAAVFPGKTRQILGLNALKTVSPFIFSFDPPELVLSYCRTILASKPAT